MTLHPSRRRWFMLALLAGLMVMNLAERTSLSVAAPLVKHDLALSNTAFGAVLSVFQWVYGIATLFGGLAVDRFGARTVLGIAAIGWALASAATGLARSFGMLLGIRSLLATAEAPIFPGMVRVIGGWFPPSERGLATSLCFTGFQLSTAIIVPFTTLLMLGMGWRGMFAVMGLLAVAPALLWVRFYRNPPIEPALVAATQPAETLRFGTWLRLFRSRAGIQLAVAGFCRQYFDGFNLWLPLFLTQAFHLSIAQVGMLAGLPSLGAAAGLLVGGAYTDRLVRRGATPFVARRRTLVIGTFGAAAAMLGMALGGGVGVTLVFLTFGCALHGFGHSSWWMIVGDIAPSQNSVASLASIQNFGGLVAMVLGPVVLGLVVDWTGGYTPIFLVTAAFSLTAAFLYGRVIAPHAQQV